MITFIPSQANAAAENLAANTRGSLIGMAINVAAVVLSLVLGWDLMGIAVGVFLYRAGELVAKLIPLQRWARTLPSVTLSPDIRRRMFTFSGRSTALTALQILRPILIGPRGRGCKGRWFHNAPPSVRVEDAVWILLELRTQSRSFCSSVSLSVIQYGDPA